MSFTGMDQYTSVNFFWRYLGEGEEAWVAVLEDWVMIDTDGSYSTPFVTTPDAQYEISASMAYADGGVNGASVGFTASPESLSPRTTKPVKDITTLEALREIEMSAFGRLHVDREGNLTYESRFGRNI
jgi:hypothetical protein